MPDGRSCVIAAGEAWTILPAADHIIALVNGGANAERNLRLVCRVHCHRAKTAADVAEKAETARKRNRHRIGERKRSRFGGSKDSPWKQKVGGGWERRET